MATRVLHSSSNNFSRRLFVSLVVVGTAFAALIHPASSLLQSSSSQQQQHPVWTSRSATVTSDKRTPENENDNDDIASSIYPNRRALLKGAVFTVAAAAATTTTTIAFHPSPAHAFSNSSPEAKQFKDRPKRKGDPPKDLGVLPRTTEGIDSSIQTPRLRTCDGNPNCFSTTGDTLLEDRQQYGVDFLVQPWVPPEGETRPITTIAAVVASYEPGQGGVDGGGFALVKATDNYLYYQFEALKKGYIDDVEFAITKDADNNSNKPAVVQVRSASRVGVTDFGVNAVRLNYISSKLRAKGWSIAEITPETHRDYWVTANEAREATFDADRRGMD